MGPRFLNIEYIFNRVYDVFLWIKYIVLFKLGNTTVAAYLSDHKSDTYDGLRDRFMIEKGDPFTHVSGSIGTGADTVVTNESAVSGVFHKILHALGMGGDSTANVIGSVGGNTTTPVDSFFMAFLGDVRDGMTIIAMIAITLYVYTTVRWKEVCEEYEGKYKKAHKKIITPVKTKPSKWAVVEAHLEGNNEAEWRMAILEADNMLFDLLKTLPMEGKDVGEKLTNASRINFKTLEDAWEAHKIRNKIAHEGSDFKIAEREVRYVIGLYKNVFNEFHFLD